MCRSRRAIDAAGVTTVAWTRPSVRGQVVESGEAVVETATAAPAAAFAVQRLANRALDGTEVALAVAPDGWALLAHAGFGGPARLRARARRVRLRRRVPRRGRRGQRADRRRPRRRRRRGGLATGLAARGRRRRDDGTTRCRRLPGGEHGGAAGPRRRQPRLLGRSPAAPCGPFPPPDEGNWTLRSALAPGGRVLLAWGGSRTRRGDGNARPASRRRKPGGRVRRTPAARQPDPRRRWPGAPVPARRQGRARVDGQRRTLWSRCRHRQAPPRGRVRTAGRRTRAPGAPSAGAGDAAPVRGAAGCGSARAATAPATCGRFCSATRSAPDRARARCCAPERRASASAARTATWAPRAGGCRVVVHAAAPGGQEFVTALACGCVSSGGPRCAVPPPLGVTARRRGSAIVVSWHTASPARRASYVVAARRSRADSGRFVRDAVRVHARTRPHALHGSPASAAAGQPALGDGAGARASTTAA